MLKDLVAIVDNASLSQGFIRNALAFAEAQDAQLAITLLTRDYMNVAALSPYDPSAIAMDQVMADQREELRALASLTEKAAVPVELRGVVEDNAYLHGASRIEGRYADLLLLGPPASYSDPRLRRRVAETAITSSGGPLLIVPEQGVAGRIRRAAVGWDASAEARRAIRDLMVLIEPGGHIDILTVDAEESWEGHGPSPGSDIARNLARHGHEVAIHHENSVGRTVHEALEAAALAHGADILAIGAFAHSRVRDILLGGVTRALLGETRLPLLLSR